MKDLLGTGNYGSIWARAMAWGALAACLCASPMPAQNMIGGKFTLGENARFGDTVLAPGQYTFSIEPIGTIHSVRSLQEGAGHLVLVVVKPAKSGPVASIFAMASPSRHAGETNELILDPEKAGTLAHTMNLEKEGLTVDFRWSTPKAKGQVVAQQAIPLLTASVSR